jgi:hypothetical protein
MFLRVVVTYQHMRKAASPTWECGVIVYFNSCTTCVGDSDLCACVSVRLLIYLLQSAVSLSWEITDRFPHKKCLEWPKMIIWSTVLYKIITMARQPYMGLGLLFPRLLGLVYLWQWGTSPLAALFDSVRRLGWEMAAEFCLRALLVLFMPVTALYIRSW